MLINNSRKTKKKKKKNQMKVKWRKTMKIVRTVLAYLTSVEKFNNGSGK